MEAVKQLIADKFLLFNVGDNKAPVDRSGRGMRNWINKSYDELVKEHNYNSKLWGISLGEQPNGRHILSLDFDVYSKTAPDGNCPITLAKLNEYIDGCEGDYGMYSSSTEGNMNVLVDYTYRQDIIDMVKKLGSNKFQHSGLEILLGGNQVIPPSQTKCKRNGVMGEPRTLLTDQFFYTISTETDFTADFIINLFNIKFQEAQPNPRQNRMFQAPSPDTTIVVPTDATDDESEEGEFKDKYIELLFSVIKNEKQSNGDKVISWDEWFQIAGILRYNHYSAETFQKYTNLTPGKVPTDSWLKLWKSLGNGNKTMSIYGLQNIAKRHNPNGYRIWLEKHNELLHLGILDKGENDVATFISRYLEPDLVFCVKDWILFNAKTCMWDIIPEPSATIITAIQNKIAEAQAFTFQKLSIATDEDERMKLLKQKKEYETAYRDVCRSSYSGQVVKLLKSYLRNDDFLDNLDNCLYKLFFRNGYLDLKTNIFKSGIQRSDFITKTIPFDWEEPTNVDIADVRKTLKKICNWNEEHLEYYLSMLGYTFTGDCAKEQNFFYLRGETASNGKSVIFEVLEKIMPTYVMKANSDVLDKGADMRKEVATWRGLKLLWLNEVSSKAKDAELVKSICDGTGYKYNRLYSTEAVVMPITFKLIAVSNNSLVCAGDAGIMRRFRLLQHNAQFKDEYVEDNYDRLEFKNDKELSSRLTSELKFALISLITTYSKAYWEEKKLKKYPAEWNEEAKENMAENEVFREWFNDNFERGLGFFIHKDEFNRMFQQSAVKYLKPKDEIARFKLGCRYDSQMKKNLPSGSGGRTIQKKGFWIGFRIKPNEEECDAGDEEEKEGY